MKQIRRHFAVYPVNTPELILRGFGVQEIMPVGTVFRPRGIDVYLLLYFYDEVQFDVDSRSFHCPPQSMILLEPDIAHEFGDNKKEWNHSWLLCSGTRFKEEIIRQNIPVNTVLSLSNPSLIEHYLLNIERELTSHAHANADIIWNSLQSCLIELGRAFLSNPTDYIIPDEYLQVKHFMDTHYTENITLTEIAAKVCHSVPRFCNNFRLFFGQSPISYIIYLRMHEAAYLLHNQNLSITEISKQLGYADLYYFSRQFRKHYGISPRQIRSKYYK